MKSIATMRLLGGRPCLDLVNTVDARRDRWGPDLLATHDDLMTWCDRVALLGEAELEEARSAATDDPEAATAAVRGIKALREAIATVAPAVAAERPPPAPATSLFGAAVDRARQHQRFGVQDGRALGWVWAGEAALERAANRVALDAAALVTDPALRRRVRLCTGPNCGWLFLDASKNGSRRWCRDEGCGAHMRMLRYRAKPT